MQIFAKFYRWRTHSIWLLARTCIQRKLFFLNREVSYCFFIIISDTKFPVLSMQKVVKNLEKISTHNNWICHNVIIQLQKWLNIWNLIFRSLNIYLNLRVWLQFPFLLNNQCYFDFWLVVNHVALIHTVIIKMITWNCTDSPKSIYILTISIC